MTGQHLRKMYLSILTHSYGETRKEWMDDFQFYILFNSISVISGRQEVDNERLCAVEPHLRLRRFRLKRDLNLGPPDQQARA